MPRRGAFLTGPKRVRPGPQAAAQCRC